MGLEIHHFKAVERPTDIFTVMDGVYESCQPKYEKFLQKKENVYIDWPKIFAEQDLNAADYVLREERLRDVAAKTRAQRKDGVYEFIARKDSLKPDAQTQITFIGKSSPLNAIERRIRSFLSKPLIVRRKLPTIKRTETVLYAEQAGLQRKGVSGQFYEEFPPGAFLYDTRYVQRIHELTSPALKMIYKRDFLDSWDHERSYIIVAW